MLGSPRFLERWAYLITKLLTINTTDDPRESLATCFRNRIATRDADQCTRSLGKERLRKCNPFLYALHCNLSSIVITTVSRHGISTV
jgi:hypothetical protein